MKPREINPKPCDPTLDTHRGGDEGQARRLLTESRVKQEEQAKLRKTDSPWGGCVVLCPRGSLQMAESSQGELDRWAGVGARFPRKEDSKGTAWHPRAASGQPPCGCVPGQE